VVFGMSCCCYVLLFIHCVGGWAVWGCMWFGLGILVYVIWFGCVHLCKWLILGSCVCTFGLVAGLMCCCAQVWALVYWFVANLFGWLGLVVVLAAC